MKVIEDLKRYYNSEQSYQKVILWNIAIAIIFLILKAYYVPGYSFLVNWFSLSANGFQSFLKPWSYISYAFLHADFFHVLSNVIMLYFSSQLFYTYFTNKQFVAVYFLGIIFSGIIYVLVSIVLNQTSVLVGASAGILAILFAVVTYNPGAEVQLLLIGRVKLWMVGAVLILFFIIQIPTSNFGGHIAHLSGVFFGFLYAKLLSKGIDMANIFDTFSTKRSRKKQIKSTPFKKVYYNDNTVKSAGLNPQLEKQKRINDILDKISNSGYDSLTSEEKNFLFKAGKD